MIYNVLVLAPFVVFAWTISPVVGLIATAAFLFAAIIGNDAWGGSGPYRRR